MKVKSSSVMYIRAEYEIESLNNQQRAIKCKGYCQFRLDRRRYAGITPQYFIRLVKSGITQPSRLKLSVKI